MTSCNVGFGFLLLVDVPNILFMSADFDLARLLELERELVGWGYKQHKPEAAAHAASAEGHAYRDSSDKFELRNKFDPILKKINNCSLRLSSFLPSINEVHAVITGFFFFLSRIAHRLFRLASSLT